jgi:acetyl-CoA synthetase
MSKNIESHLSEDRVFKPSKEFSKKARVKSMAQYKRMYQESIDKPGVFWAREAKELAWQKKMDKSARLESSLREVVCWWQTERLRKLR